MSATTTANDTPRSTARSPRLSSRRRNDIQGLRAILMAQVLLYHAWSIGSPIGVDSFVLVSAFLMTSSFVRRAEQGHMPFFVERWGNTFKRLLPPLVIVVLATLAATFVFLPATRWKETTIQAFASLTYWENWRLVEVAADYYANDHGLSSPLQHLWSMSMQGQMFLLWPFLMTLCVLFARKVGVSIRKIVIAAFGIIMVLSLLWLLFLAPADGSVYFDTRARIWEFAFGSMVAAAAPWLKISRRAALGVTTVSLAVLVVFCLVSIGSYPGPMAFIPMACVSALMLYVPTLRGGGVDKALSVFPLVALGDISYCVYLVHWPIFVIYQAHMGKDSLNVAEGIALITVSILIAWTLTKLVDDPLRMLPWSNASTPHKYVVVAASLAIGLLPVLATYWWIEATSRRGELPLGSTDLVGTEHYTAVPESGPGSSQFPGARILMEDLGEPVFLEDPIPGPLADPLYSRWEDDACSDDLTRALASSERGWCTAIGDPKESTARVLVVGTSHAQQLLLAQITPLIEANNWSAYAVLGQCQWTLPGVQEYYSSPEVIKECDYVMQVLLDQLDTYQPDYVFMVVTLTKADSTEEILIPGIEGAIAELTSRGIEVIGVRDNARSEEDLRECAADRPSDKAFGGCLLPESNHFADEDPTAPLGDIDGFHLVDYRDMYCTDGVCPTIIGNVFVYFDDNHISGEYAISMAPFFSQRVAEELGLPH